MGGACPGNRAKILGRRVERRVRLFRLVSFQRHLLVVVDQVLRPEEMGAPLVQVAIKLVEALLRRPAFGAKPAQPPLAEAAGAVACVLQHLGDGLHLRRQGGLARDDALLIERGSVAAHRGASHVQPRHEHAAGGRADGGPCVELREAQALAGHPGEVGRVDLILPVGFDVAVAEIVGKDKDDVRPVFRGRLRFCRAQGQRRLTKEKKKKRQRVGFPGHEETVSGFVSRVARLFCRRS